MLEKMSDLLPKPVSEYIPDALDKAIDTLDIAPEGLKKAGVWEKYLETIPSIVIIILCAMFLLWAGRWINRGLTTLKTRRMTDSELIKRANTVSSVMGYAYSVFIYIGTILLIFEKLGIAIAPLLGAAGIFGIAIGFGAQSLVKDYFTGLFLLIENQLRRGDVVEVGGKSGVVEEVTLRYVCLRDYQGRVHFVPNSMISTVTNLCWGHGFAVMDIGVSHRENLDRCIDVMKRVGAELRTDEEFALKIFEDLEVAGVEDWTANSIVLRCRFKVIAAERWAVRREFLKRLKIAFEREGIEVPLPHMIIQKPLQKDSLPESTALEDALTQEAEGSYESDETRPRSSEEPPPPPASPRRTGKGTDVK